MPDSEKLQDKDGSHWETIDSKIPRTLRHAVVRILGLFSGLPLRWQLICAVAGLTVAGFCGYYLQRILFNSQANLSRTLAATMVSTAYPHRGVTAFLVGELDKNVPSAKDDPTLKSAVEKIAEDINSLSNSDFPEQKQNQVLDELDFEVRDKPNLGHPEEDGGHTWTKIIQSKKKEQDNAFLMVPAISVRQQTLNKNVLQDKVLKEVLRYNPEVVFDFYVAKQIDEKLKLLNKPAAAHPLGIVQAYFISESGVILLRQLTTNKSYENTFPPNTLFMDRLYFWGAINPDEFSRPKYEGGPLKFATEPYIDLGGNGVVITFSQRVELPNMRNGVICVDVALPIGTESEIEKRLKDLEAVVLPNTFISEERSFENTLPADFQWLNQPAVVDGPTSRITGAIAFESDFLKRGDVSTDDQVVRFTVPITSAIRFNGSKKTTATKLLLVTFDFRSTGKWIFWSSLGFAAGIGLFMVVAANLLWKFVDLGHQMDRVLEKMSTVMYDATTPFIWLNEKNEFVKVNVSFLHALGCDTEHELLNHARRFKDLVTAESAPDYEDKLERSARGEPTPKYQIEIKKVTGEKISVWVHGEGVPSARLGRRRPPHRFGVFLPEPKPDHASPK